VAESLKIAGMNAWAFDGAKASFTIVNGEVILQPFDTKIGGMASTLGGKSGLDQSINYLMNIEIPRAKFGGAAASVLSTLTAKAGAAGIKTGNSENIPVGIKIGGTVLNPKITTDIRDRAENAMDDLKKQAEDRAREELEKRKKELEDRTNAEKDKLKKEAEAKLKQEQERLKNEADKVKQEAERKAKEEADKAKKKAEEEAKKQLNKLFKGK
jgi:flagellar biosynthesis GTPase FlhF